MQSTPELIERLHASGLPFDASLSPPARGRTPERFKALMELGRTDLSLARIAEAHLDALAILAEAGHDARAGALYGVWASDGPQGRLIATRDAADGWRLDGTKQFCSGAPFLQAALVTAHGPDGLMLFDVSLGQRGIRVLPSTWETPAMADTGTTPVLFDEVRVTRECEVGGVNWYLERPGFWHGAINPAACWAGGALSLIDAAAALRRRDPHSKAHVGALLAHAWSLEAWLIRAGEEIDAAPDQGARVGRARALKVRQLVERTCADVLDRFGRCTGPQLLAFDAHIVRQHMALNLYVRQCHAERDLEALAESEATA